MEVLSMPKSKIEVNWEADLLPNKNLKSSVQSIIFPKKTPGCGHPDMYKDAVILIAK